MKITGEKNMKLTRRDFLRIGAVGVLTPYLLFRGGELVGAQTNLEQWFVFDEARNAADVFGLSVASGDPSASGVILWTRVNAEVWSAQQKLAFQVADDENFQNVVVQGVVDAADFSAARDFTVKIDLDGRLAANRQYFYRFIYNRTASRAGRCRTLPAANQSINVVKFGVLTCQDFTNGYYGALQHLADEDVDFVIHLGDFVYESAGDPRFQSLPYADRTMILPSGGIVALGLEDFRFIYRRYRSDAFLQRAMERHTWIMIWDDHETCNDCYWDYARDTLGAPDHPFTKDAQYGNNPALLKQLKLEAQRAWLEYVPARVQVNEAATHPHDYYKIYRQFRFGNLLELFMTDERTYRSPHPCGEDAADGGYGARYVSPGCPAQQDATRTMLGAAQRDWLTGGVKNSRATWKVWGNQVFTAPLKIGGAYFNLDAWDGYEAERRAIMRRFAQDFVKNLVVLTGDLHTYMASYLKVDYAIPQNSDVLLPQTGLPNVFLNNLVGVEFMTPGVTSANLREILQGVYPPQTLSETTVRANNPHIRFFNSDSSGYSVVGFTPTECTYTAYAVDKSQNSASAAKSVMKRLRVPVNRVEILDA
jgi:alkaline phosphatase D